MAGIVGCDANRAALLTYVAANPGATVAQIADATGIAKPTLHTAVSQLKRRGDLIADGREVKLQQGRRARQSQSNCEVHGQGEKSEIDEARSEKSCRRTQSSEQTGSHTSRSERERCDGARGHDGRRRRRAVA